MSEIKKYTSIGLMSGSSLDGVDLALCSFEVLSGKASFQIIKWSIEEAETIPYPASWIKELKSAPKASGLSLSLMHTRLGHYYGGLLHNFIKKLNKRPDFISSHGHTIFHYPDQQMTLQIGDGASIAAITGIDVYDNFRLQDIALGGQGAPLSPIADYHLFNDYKYTLNIGGIANINIKNKQQYRAYDLCGANQILNALSAEMNQEYDKNGVTAAKGKLISELFNTANKWSYLHLDPPKSLGNNQVAENTTLLFKTHPGTIEDRLHTACHHIAFQIAKSIQAFTSSSQENLLITGGGGHNSFLIRCIQSYLPSNIKIVIPSAIIINYKECLLMSLLGLLHKHNQPTTLIDVTGATKNTIGGVLHRGFSNEPI